jgi:hypothetical protein
MQECKNTRMQEYKEQDTSIKIEIPIFNREVLINSY